MRAQQFRFQVRTPQGEVVSGVLAAETATGAALALRTRGDEVLALAPIAAASAGTRRLAEILNYSSGPSRKDILDFTTQLAVMIRAGISIRAALEGIAE